MKNSTTETQRLLRAAAEAEVKEQSFASTRAGEGARATRKHSRGRLCHTISSHLEIFVHREALRRLGIGWAGIRGGDGEAAVSVAGAVRVKTAAVAAHQQIAGRAQVVERGVVALAGIVT